MSDYAYSDWFGSGDTKEDVKDAIKEYGEPLKVFYEESGYMASLIYEDKVVTVGYDSNEYTHNFLMNKEESE